MECNIVTSHPMTYRWLLNGITVINDGTFTQSIYDLRPGLLNISPQPIQISNRNDIINLVVKPQSDSHSPFDPLSCYDHNISASLEGMLYYIAAGNWTCETENLYGRFSGSIIVNEPGKLYYN